MWYDTLGEYWLNTESFIWERLREIAEDNSEYFNPDDLIDEMYSPVNYFGVVFYPHRIIKQMDNDLYQEIWDNLMNDWVDDAAHRLELLEPEEGDAMGSLLDENFKGLENIVWKEQE